MKRMGAVAVACGWIPTLGIIGLALCAPPAARADILHLTNGSSIEGEVLGEEGDVYRVRTSLGPIQLPKSSVDRIEESPTPFAEYERRLESAPETVEGHRELGSWCLEQGLENDGRRHLRKALEIAPDDEATRRLLGYVRVGPVWVDSKPVARPARAGDAPRGAGEADDSADPDQLVAAIQGRWARQIRAIRNNMLDASIDRLVRQGREKILAIADPLAILPLSRELSQGKVPARAVLVEALSRFIEDEATLNLSAVALMDSDDSVRNAAISELVRRADPRVAAQLRLALQSNNDVLIRRGAIAVKALRLPEAVPDLIDVLTAQRRRTVEVPVRSYLAGVSQAFSTPTRVRFGSSTVVHSPALGAYPPGYGVFVSTALERRTVTVMRTEVLEALAAITGENFGFDGAAWRRWYEESQK